MDRGKLFIRLSLFLVLALILSAVQFPAFAIDPVPTISGETSRTTKEITLSDGTKTGVIHTQIKTNGHYGSNRLVNIAECDLSNRNLSIEVINCGTYIANLKTISSASADYNSKNPGKTVLAAVNGDLWMTEIHCNTSVTKKSLYATRGILIVDGEIWASQQIDQENLLATNAEKGTPAAEKSVFAVTDQNQPLIGAPLISIALDIGGKAISADGINRLPATNSIIVYNQRINSSNYALNDSYEVVITADNNSAFRIGEKLTGTISAIYPSGSTTRPSLNNSQTIVLTARGSRISELQSACAVGKKVTLTPSITDPLGNNELWQNVEDAISGHMRLLYDGVGAPINQSTYYPTTLIGYKDDGTVSFLSFTSSSDGSRSALKISQSYELCRELGYNSVFYLDGGGSTTFVTLENGNYTVRNKCSDGHERAVINGIGIVWNDTPVCMRQGSLNHIDVPPEISAYSPAYIDGALLADLVRDPNKVALSYSSSEKALAMTVTETTNDPFATLDYTSLKRVSAEDYPYVVVNVRSSKKIQSRFSLYYACGSDIYAGGDRVKSAAVSASGARQSITFDMSGAYNWSGNINNIRLDIFEGFNSSAGDTMYIDSVILCKNSQEAEAAKNGWIPAGACPNYLELKESLKPTPYFLTGDIIEDNEINLLDMFRMKQLLAAKSTPTNAEEYSCDVDGDGDITMLDSFELRFRLSKGYWKY